MNAIAERPAALMNFIERAAKDETFNLDKFRELLLMQREAEQINARHEFNLAMSAVQSELQTVVRDRDNPHTRSRYATLQALDASARPIYTQHGFSVRFGTAAAPWEGWVRVTCELSHVGGYSEQHYLDGPLDAAGSQGKSNKTGIQAIGSTVSYLRRYLLMLVLNLVTADDADDDGEATRRDRQADRAYSPRDAINADIPLRAAAADMKRADKIADKAKVYEAAETDDQKWLRNLETKLSMAKSQDEVVRISDMKSVKDAVAHAPPQVQQAVSELLANAYARFAEAEDAATEEAEASGWPGDELAEVEIVGAEKVAAG